MFSLYEFIEKALTMSEELRKLENEASLATKLQENLQRTLDKMHGQLTALKKESLSTSHQIKEKELEIEDLFERENKEKRLLDEHMSSHVRMLAQKSLQSIQICRLSAEAELENLYQERSKNEIQFKEKISAANAENQDLERDIEKQEHQIQALKAKQKELIDQFTQLAKSAPQTVVQKVFYDGNLTKFAVTKVTNHMCTKCFYPVSSAQYNALTRGDVDLIECKNCFTSLYIDKRATV